MELVRYAIAAIFFGVSAYGFFSFTSVPEAITVTGAKLYPRGEALLLEAEISNPGRPDRLLGLGSEAASRSLLTAENLVVPGGSRAALKMDAAHGMLIGAHGKVYEGRTIPITLWFESWGPVRTRAKVAEMVRGDTPTARLGAISKADLKMTIDEREDGIWARLDPLETHVGPIGEEPRAVLYLNGMQLRALVDGEAPLGQLPPGPHLVSVILQNTTGQRYSNAGHDLSVVVPIMVE